MYFRPPMYEGDGYIRDGLAKHLNPANIGNPDTPSPSKYPLTLEELGALERDARQTRSAVVGAWLGRFGQWLVAIPARARQTAAERYLASSTDHADLERRIRDLEYSRFRQIA